ncbi:MAG: hypothetical protein ACFB11_16680 [Paracoccaceae bacterium]
MKHARKAPGAGQYFLASATCGGIRCNHERVRRKPDVNLRTKPCKQSERENLPPLIVPEAPKNFLSTDVMQVQLADVRSFRMQDVRDDLDHEALAS